MLGRINLTAWTLCYMQYQNKNGSLYVSSASEGLKTQVYQVLPHRYP